jgi:hypothetical protein
MIPKEETYTNHQSQDLDKDIFLHVMSPHDDCCGFIPCITQNFNLSIAPRNRPQNCQNEQKGPKTRGESFTISSRILTINK